MGREHVVIAGDDAQVQRLVAGKGRLFGRAAGGKAMGEISAGKHRAVDARLAGLVETGEIVAAAVAAARRDAIGNILDGLADRHVWLLTFGGARPGRKWRTLPPATLRLESSGGLGGQLGTAKGTQGHQ